MQWPYWHAVLHMNISIWTYAATYILISESVSSDNLTGHVHAPTCTDPSTGVVPWFIFTVTVQLAQLRGILNFNYGMVWEVDRTAIAALSAALHDFVSRSPTQSLVTLSSECVDYLLRPCWTPHSVNSQASTQSCFIHSYASLCMIQDCLRILAILEMLTWCPTVPLQYRVEQWMSC